MNGATDTNPRDHSEAIPNHDETTTTDHNYSTKTSVNQFFISLLSLRHLDVVEVEVGGQRVQNFALNRRALGVIDNRIHQRHDGSILQHALLDLLVHIRAMRRIG